MKNGDFDALFGPKGK